MDLTPEATERKKLRTTAAMRVTMARNRTVRLMFDATKRDEVIAALVKFDALYDEYLDAHDALCEMLDSETWPHEEALFRRHEADAVEFRARCRNWLNDTLPTQPAAPKDEGAATSPAAPLDKVAATSSTVHALDAKATTPSAAKSSAGPAVPFGKGAATPVAGPAAPSSPAESKSHVPPSASLLRQPVNAATTAPSAMGASASWPQPTFVAPPLPSQLSTTAAVYTPPISDSQSIPRQVPMFHVPQSTYSVNRRSSYVTWSPNAPSSHAYVNDPDLNVSFCEDFQNECNVALTNPASNAPTAHADPLLTALSLPKPDLDVFSGDIAQYQLFISSFDTRIANRLSSESDKLFYLHQFVRGDARELIAGCFHLYDDGYREARRLLDREYGDPYRTSTEFMRQISDFAQIKPDDPRALRKFAMLLNKCLQAMRHVQHLSVLDHPSSLITAVHKLPAYLQNKWRERAFDISRNATPTFTQLVDFVVRASDVANDPVFGKSPAPYTDQKSDVKPKKFINLAASFNAVMCRCCNMEDHEIVDCPAFNEKSVSEKRDLLKKLNLCFGCMRPGHFASRCRNRMKCDKCSKGHPTCLHIDDFVMPNRYVTPNDVGNRHSEESANAGIVMYEPNVKSEAGF